MIANKMAGEVVDVIGDTEFCGEKHISLPCLRWVLMGREWSNKFQRIDLMPHLPLFSVPRIACNYVQSFYRVSGIYVVHNFSRVLFFFCFERRL